MAESLASPDGGPAGEHATGKGAVAVVLMTAPGMESAEAIVRALVDEGLAACGNILPGATSIYRWEGAVERASETVMILKTTRRRVGRLVRRSAELHPYDVPEILAHEVSDGFGPYLAWVAAECAAAPQQSAPGAGRAT